MKEHEWSARPPAIEGALPIRDPTTFVDAARFHGVAGCAYLSLRHVTPDDQGAVAALKPAYFGALRNHLEVVTELGLAAAALDSAGLPWMVLKGPVLAEAVYCRPDLRSYSDLDLLVRPQDFGVALGTLEGAGYRVEDRNWELLRHEMLGEVQLTTPRGIGIDLHWHPLNESWLRRVVTLDVSSLFDRSRFVRVGSKMVRTLAAADTLVYLTVHSARSGGNRLMWLKDLEQAILYDRASWVDVVAVATRWGAGLICASMFRRAQQALGVAVGADVLDALEAGCQWGRLVSLVETAMPVERTLGHRSLVRAVARSTRTDDRSSALALFRAAGDAARQRQLRTAPPRPDADPESGRSIYRPTGGDAGRERFVAAVSRSSGVAEP